MVFSSVNASYRMISAKGLSKYRASSEEEREQRQL
jgi:hypothetical protein